MTSKFFVGIIRWQGTIDGALAGRVTANSRVEVEVSTRGRYHYLCLSKPTETLTTVQDEVFRVRMACEAEDWICKPLYFLPEDKTEEVESEHGRIIQLEQKIAEMQGGMRRLADEIHEVTRPGED